MLITEAGHTWVTDLGRFAGPRLGFSVNGALDQYSARVANILAGNEDDTALLETLQLGLAFTAEKPMLIAVTGAENTVTVDGRQVPMWTPLSVRAGQSVRVGRARKGLRTYVAVRGGFEVPRLMGSCAPDSMIGFGTQLTDGMRLEGAIPTHELRNPYFDVPLFRLPLVVPRFSLRPVVPVTDGPDIDEFGDSADRLFTQSFTVSPRSNHVGLRLTGRPPKRQVSGEVLSRGVPVGAIEVPSEEGLLLLHRGRGVTAGYPVLAVVTALGLDQVAQTQPGSEMSFRRVSVVEAREDYLTQQHALKRLRSVCRTILAAHGATTAYDHPAALQAA